MKYAILMEHGVDLHSWPGTLADVHDRLESMPCASSTKTQPDSRGLVPAIHVLGRQKKDVDARHRSHVYAVCAKQTAVAGHEEIYSLFWSRNLAQHPGMNPPLRMCELNFLRRALRLGGIFENRKTGSARPRHPRQPCSVGSAEHREHLTDHRLNPRG